MYKQNPNRMGYERGVTISEILISIVLLALIFLPFWEMFVQDDTDSVAATILEASYESQRQIEYLYSVSQEYSLQDGRAKLSQDGFFEIELIAGKDFKYEKTTDYYHVVFELRTEGYSEDLVNVIVKVYRDETLQQLYTQTETVLVWTH